MVTRSTTQLKVERLAGALGAAVTGVDLTQPLDDEAFAVIKQA